MQQLHNDLLNSSRLYKAWHDHELHSVLHLMVFVAVALLAAQQFTLIIAEDLSSSAPTVPLMAQAVSVGNTAENSICNPNTGPCVVWSAQDPSPGSVDVSRDGNIIATVNNSLTNTSITIWRKDGTVMRNISAVGRRMKELSLSPEGALVAIASSLDKKVRIYRTDTGELVRDINIDSHSGHPAPVKFSPDGTLLAVGYVCSTYTIGGCDAPIYLYRTSDWSMLRSLKSGGYFATYSLDFSQDGGILLSGGSGNMSLALWNINSGSLIKSWVSESDVDAGINGAYSAVFSPDGSKIAAKTGYRGIIRVWDLSGNILSSFHSGSGTLAVKLRFSPNQNMLAFGEYEWVDGVAVNVIKFLNLNSNPPTLIARYPVISFDLPYAFAPGGSGVYFDTPAGQLNLAMQPSVSGSQPPPANLPPTVSIISPDADSFWSYTEPINFSASALDPEDGNISSMLVWASNIQGQIGTGAAFTRMLSPGAHTITANATDSKGSQRSASVSITVSGVEASIALSRQSINFGNVEAGKSISETILVANNGAANLSLGSISASPQEFSVSPSTAILLPGQSVSLTVTFNAPPKGKSPYTYTGSLNINHNAANANSPVIIGLQGTKIAAPKGGGRK